MTMRSWAFKIFQYPFSLFMAVALVGVNVNRGSCGCCDMDYVQVRIVPQEQEHACGEEEACCCGRDDACPAEHSDAAGGHVFYKVNEYSEVEQGVKLDIHWCSLAPDTLLPLLCCTEDHEKDFRKDRIFSGVPLQREKLCVYRC